MTRTIFEWIMCNAYFYAWNTLLLLCLISVVACQQGPGGNPPGDPFFETWDTDGDGISNEVENNNANAYLGFNDTIPDIDPSIAHGTYTNGTLENGINLVDRGDIFHGYYHYNGTDPIDYDDWGTLTIINKIEAAARWWEGRVVFDFGVGDISLRNGGYFPPHVSHQNGLDADFRYIRTDREELPLDLSTPDSVLFDTVATATLISALLYAWGDTTNTIFFVDTNYVPIYDPTNLNRIRHDPHHANHFHMRIPDPDGTNN